MSVVDAFRGDQDVHIRTATENFADHPLTIGEIRAEREKSGAAWSPRDVLIELLRMIDRGDVAPDVLFVAYSQEMEPGARRTSFSCAGKDPSLTLGCIERAKFEYLSR